ncbi:MAG: Bug family tripartite tricarboxylate transporter substrate binding protein [Acetobacteraceae bacterium]
MTEPPRVSRRLLLAVPAVFAAGRAAAQAWPSRPMRLIVPFPPGGTTDIVGRLVAARMGAALGQPMVVENRPGAGGTVGSDLVAKSPPDGHVFVVSNIAAHGVAPSIYPSLPYDPVRDFTHIALLASTPSALAVPATSPVRSFADFVQRARTRDVTVASPGNGSSSHVLTGLLAHNMNLRLVHVPYRGSAPGITALMAGEVDAMITTLLELGGNDRIRMIASTAARRSPGYGDLPTFAELGRPEMTAPTWFGLSGPAGLPAPIADRLHAEALAALREPDVARRLAELVATPEPLGRADYAALVAREVARWAEAVRISGARAD